MDDESVWMDSHEAARLMRKHPLKELRVDIHGELVPVDNVRYDPDADCIIIELYDR